MSQSCGWEVQLQVSWILCLGSEQAEIKMPAGLWPMWFKIAWREVGESTKMIFRAKVALTWVPPPILFSPAFVEWLFRNQNLVSNSFSISSFHNDNIRCKRATPDIRAYSFSALLNDCKYHKGEIVKSTRNQLVNCEISVMERSVTVDKSNIFQQDRKRERETTKSYQCHLVERPILKCSR